MPTPVLPGVPTGLEAVILKLLRENPRARKPLLIVSGVAGTAALGAVAYLSTTTWAGASVALGIAVVLLIGSFVTFAMVLLSYLSSVEISGLSFELRTAESNRQELQQKVRERPRDPYAHAELGAAELRVFYAINQSQARSSFRFGVFSVLIGLAFLLFGVILFYTQQSVTPAAISSIGGVTAQFIGASSLYLYNRVQSQSQYYHDYLGRYQRLVVAVALCNSIEDKVIRDNTRRNLVLDIIAADAVITSSAATPIRLWNRRSKRPQATSSEVDQ